MRARAILETCLYVSDLAAAEKFYTTMLGLELVEGQDGRHVFLRCGRQMFLLFNPAVCEQPHGMFPPHGARGPGHVAFAVSEHELSQWREQLALNHVAIEKTIDWPNGGHSIYFRDPAGNLVELATPKLWGWPDDS